MDYYTLGANPLFFGNRSGFDLKIGEKPVCEAPCAPGITTALQDSADVRFFWKQSRFLLDPSAHIHSTAAVRNINKVVPIIFTGVKWGYLW